MAEAVAPPQSILARWRALELVDDDLRFAGLAKTQELVVELEHLVEQGKVAREARECDEQPGQSDGVPHAQECEHPARQESIIYLIQSNDRKIAQSPVIRVLAASSRRSERATL